MSHLQVALRALVARLAAETPPLHPGTHLSLQQLLYKLPAAVALQTPLHPGVSRSCLSPDLACRRPCTPVPDRRAPGVLCVSLSVCMCLSICLSVSMSLSLFVSDRRGGPDRDAAPAPRYTVEGHSKVNFSENRRTFRQKMTKTCSKVPLHPGTLVQANRL